MGLQKYEISKTSDKELTAFTCSNLCQAYDYFLLNPKNPDDPSVALCLCGINISPPMQYTDKNGNKQTVTPNLAWFKTLPKSQGPPGDYS